MYIDAGFDGWILKPIDFQRLNLMLLGIVEDETRESCLYRPGHWEQGGWLTDAPADVFSSNTAPSGTAPVSQAKQMESYPVQPSTSDTDQERDRLQSLDNDAVHAKSQPVNPGYSGDMQHSLEASGDHTDSER